MFDARLQSLYNCLGGGERPPGIRPRAVREEDRPRTDGVPAAARGQQGGDSIDKFLA